MRRRDNRIGVFSTVPVEAIVAAGLVPMDVNNLFVHQLDPREILYQSDAAGLPRNLCAWTRGLFAATQSAGLRQVVVVPEGDCTNNVTMARLLERRGVDVIEFRYPLGAQDRRQTMEEEMERFCRRLGTTLPRARQVFQELRPVRGLLAEIDRLCWQERRIPGSEARVFLLESTDMRGNPSLYARRLERAIEDSRSRSPMGGPPVAIFGVPTGLVDLQSRVEAAGGFVALCETEHDFAMLPPAVGLEEQYLAYAYPYGISGRLERFKRLLEERSIAGVIIHSQSFCHHNLELTRIERSLSSLPTLVIEADVPSHLPSRDLLRLEAFLSLLRSAPPGAVRMVDGRRVLRSPKGEVGWSPVRRPGLANSNVAGKGLRHRHRYRYRHRPPAPSWASTWGVGSQRSWCAPRPARCGPSWTRWSSTGAMRDVTRGAGSR